MPVASVTDRVRSAAGTGSPRSSRRPWRPATSNGCRSSWQPVGRWMDSELHLTPTNDGPSTTGRGDGVQIGRLLQHPVKRFAATITKASGVSDRDQGTGLRVGETGPDRANLKTRKEKARVPDVDDLIVRNGGAITWLSCPHRFNHAERQRCQSVQRDTGTHNKASSLDDIHQISAGMRSGEHRPRETASRPFGVGAGAQPLPHNPRKQRKNPAIAGSGDRFSRGKWRRGRDRGRTFSRSIGSTGAQSAA
ncbi:hypothetical protein SAMN04515678_1011 [Roseivivax sediminis]|uniref:Uncharacterized protein n=1 Tax=Roseivivax sediminis TaxID=936889 RepID=A0A1I1S6F7_9RHOB|nr:hypothetical protein SAMN04515678_1011 [Roseivivax sediminis]